MEGEDRTASCIHLVRVVLGHAEGMKPSRQPVYLRALMPTAGSTLTTLVTSNMKKQSINSCTGGCLISELSPRLIPGFISLCLSSPIAFISASHWYTPVSK